MTKVVILQTILLTITVNASMYYIKQMDWTAGYNCPSYCGVDHEHIGLDWQSSLETPDPQNRKSNKIRNLDQ